MSPALRPRHASPSLDRALARVAVAAGIAVHDERIRRRWALRMLADRAGLSVAAVHKVESGLVASLETYVRLADALGLKLELLLIDPRRKSALVRATTDQVHAAMGEFEARHLASLGYPLGIDEPFQHYQFAGRADVVAWNRQGRALLHIENRTRFPDVQDAAGAWNAKRSYFPAAFAERVGLNRGWTSVTHVMVAIWSSEVLHMLRLRTATFRSLCPDPADAFVDWWSGSAPAAGMSSTLIVLDPLASGRQRLFVGLEDALRVEPRYRGYADIAQRLSGDRRVG